MEETLRNKATIYNFTDRRGINGGYGDWKKWGSISQDRRRLNPQNEINLFPDDQHDFLKRNLSTVLSLLYGILITVFGWILCVTDSIFFKIDLAKNFSIYMSAVGLMWLLFHHFSLTSYKNKVKRFEENERLIYDRVTIRQSSFDDISPKFSAPPEQKYTFLRGRHAGSFYLKIGAAVFALGHLIGEGLAFGQEMLLLSHNSNCFLLIDAILHVIVPLFSFYELFIVFKFSNVVIKCNQGLARFGFMHLIASSVCFWFSALIKDFGKSMANLEAHDALVNITSNEGSSIFQSKSKSFIIKLNRTNELKTCELEEINNFGENVIPFLYPFTIEYNMILVGVWFLQWCHINDQPNSEEMQSEMKSVFPTTRTSMGTLKRKHRTSASSFQIDCHSAHRGLFFGIIILFLIIVSIVCLALFYQHEDTIALGYNIHMAVKILLQGTSIIVLFFAYFQITKLKVGNLNQAIFLDNILLFCPIPLLFFGSLFSMVSEIYFYAYLGIAFEVLQLVQVMFQTPFLTDALRRSSPSKKLQKLKPGRQLITILLAINLALWILGNADIKFLHIYHSGEKFYGHFLWTTLVHLTLPFMLFYRFHSTICLADIWKSAYEDEE